MIEMNLEKFAKTLIYTGIATTFISAGLIGSDIYHFKGRINEDISMKEAFQKIYPRYEYHASLGIAGLSVIAIGGGGQIVSKLRRMKESEEQN